MIYDLFLICFLAELKKRVCGGVSRGLQLLFIVDLAQKYVFFTKACSTH